jgi:hypothetical protein
MAQWKSPFLPEISTGMNRDSLTDLYRLKHGMPLDGESHNRFLATKVPIRLNKDYRARLRNFVAGYPVSNLIITY